MLKKLWLVFAQAVTVLLALMFTFAARRPEWLPQRFAPGARPPAEALPAPEAPRALGPRGTAPGKGAPRQAASKPAAAIVSYSSAAQRATASVG
ncbi:MAG: 2-alkenal reductase, partial [Burkholderiales bacterium]|nr:2-alkenal reductase [Burkholderiales bacterium]